MTKTNQTKTVYDLLNAIDSLNNRKSFQVELLIDFVQQQDKTEELLKYMSNVAENEKMPIYKEAALDFISQNDDDDYIYNNYESNKEGVLEGSTFLLERPKLLIDDEITKLSEVITLEINDEMIRLDKIK